MPECRASNQPVVNHPRSGAGTGHDDDHAITFGGLLARLSALERQGHAATAHELRDRLRAAVQASSLDELRE
jgi:hypothetical protein